MSTVIQDGQMKVLDTAAVRGESALRPSAPPHRQQQIKRYYQGETPDTASPSVLDSFSMLSDLYRTVGWMIWQRFRYGPALWQQYLDDPDHDLPTSATSPDQPVDLATSAPHPHRDDFRTAA